MSSTPRGHSLPPTRRDAPPPRSVGFFAHHGIWAPGVRLFRRLRFASKAAIISLAFMVPAGLLIGWLLWSIYEDSMRARIDATRQHVEVAHGVIAWAHGEAQAGRMSDVQARETARTMVAGLRYDRSEYFWINDYAPRMVMHPMRPELDGRDLSLERDPNGLPLFERFVEVARSAGAGYVAYQWPRPGSDLPVDKISFVKAFEPWGWVIGSGVYVSDVRDAMTGRLVLTGSALALSLLLVGYLFVSFYRVMDGGLRETRRHLRAMADGDLTTSPSPWGSDEPAQLMVDLRSMQDALRSVVGNVRRASDAIVAASGEIAGGAEDLSARTVRASSSLVQSAAAMERIADTVRTSADGTDAASQAARSNAQVAHDGGERMGAVANTMAQIQQSSRRIREIIGTIDGIAFQTNILALNAAVEAARAGEQGRGFAVVAAEVRTLAQRSAEASRQIRDLIESSVARVEAGSTLVGDTAATIGDIVSASRNVDRLLSEIAASAQAQRIGIGDVRESVSELDRATQENAALAEQTAAAAASMSDQARALAGEVARFRLP